jgi:hypothetical protein
MITKASGLLAVLMAAGLFACVAAPSPVEAAGSGGATASDSDSASSVEKQTTRHGKRAKSAQSESKSSESQSSGSRSSEAKKPEVADAAAVSLPASVANAKAELTADVPADTASARSAKPNTLLAASDKPDEAKAPDDTDVVASDQLNEMDRALQESQSQNQSAAQPPAPAAAMMTAQAPTPASAAPVATADDSTWDRTSLIGKIFIAAGALLTMASAARMFMA